MKHKLSVRVYQLMLRCFIDIEVLVQYNVVSHQLLPQCQTVEFTTCQYSPWVVINNAEKPSVM